MNLPAATLPAPARAEQDYQESVRFEKLLGELSIGLIKLGQNEVDAAIEEVLHLIGDFIRADEVRLLSLPDDFPDHKVSHAWVAKGDTEELACSSATFFDRFPVASDRLHAGKPLMYGSLDELPPQAQTERSYLADIGLLAAIAYPVFVDTRLTAVLFIHRFEETHWPDTLVKRLPQIAAILGNALARKQAQTELQMQLEFEKLLSDASSRFVNPPPDAIDAEIEGTLAELGKFFQVDRAFVARFSDELTVQTSARSFGWVAPGVSREDRLLEGLVFNQSFPWMTARLRSGRVFHYPSEQLPPEAAAERGYIGRAGIKASILVPLALGGDVSGVVILDSFDEKRRWNTALAQRLRLIGEIIASALDRKQHIAALRERGQLLRATLERAPAGVALADANGTLVQANPSFCRMLGYAETELTGRDVRDLVLQDDRHLSEAALRAVVEEDTDTFPHEKRYVRKDGSMVWAQVVTSGLRDASGRLQYVIAVAIDISRRKAAEQDLTRALAEVRSLKDRLEAENLLLREEIELHQPHEEITGTGPAIRRVKAEIERVAPTESTVFILGETGTGKELVASALHRLSTRRNKPMIKVNCAALPEALIEAELFGREKGAYTGALTRQVGRFEVADGGTLFLDEIGELPPGLQSKLLRALQDGEFERLGSTRTIRVDVRLIAATNRDLDEAIREGRFREDLFYRLNVFPIKVPPLRDRPEDIPALVWTMIGECCEKTGRTIRSIPNRDMNTLVSNNWPGNVRELRNVIERALILNQGTTLHVAVPDSRKDHPTIDGDETLEGVERAHIAAILARTGWRIRGENGAAAILGLKPTTLEYRIKKLGLTRPSSAS